jgi:hypothetical protein
VNIITHHVESLLAAAITDIASSIAAAIANRANNSIRLPTKTDNRWVSERVDSMTPYSQWQGLEAFSFLDGKEEYCNQTISFTPL